MDTRLKPSLLSPQVQEAGCACLRAPCLVADFGMKAELESVTAEEQMRTEQATTGVHSKGK